MKRLTVATAIVAVAFAANAPLARGQTTPGSGATPPAAAVRGDGNGPGMMYGQGQVQGQVESQGGNAPGITYGRGQGAYGPGMMGGYGLGWMGGYGGLWVLALLAIAAAGIVSWVVRKKKA